MSGGDNADVWQVWHAMRRRGMLRASDVADDQTRVHYALIYDLTIWRNLDACPPVPIQVFSSRATAYETRATLRPAVGFRQSPATACRPFHYTGALHYAYAYLRKACRLGIHTDGAH